MLSRRKVFTGNKNSILFKFPLVIYYYYPLFAINLVFAGKCLSNNGYFL